MFKLIPLPYKLAALGVLLAVISIALWRIHDNIWDSGYEAGVVAQSKIAKAECDKAQQISQEVSNEYQKRISDLNNQLTTLRMRPPKCIAIAKPPACGHNAAAIGDEYVGQNGVPAEALYGFAGEAERYRLRLIACQNFINKTQR